MKKIVLSLAVLFCSFSFVSAQDFNSALGIRFGNPWAVSYKYFASESAAFEGIVSLKSSTFYSWISVGAAYQIHKDISSASGLQWYYGAGASAAFFNYDASFGGDEVSLSLGIQGYIGLSYTFDGIPLNLSIDWVPTFYLNGPNDGCGGGYGALAARYVMSY